MLAGSAPPRVVCKIFATDPPFRLAGGEVLGYNPAPFFGLIYGPSSKTRTLADQRGLFAHVYDHLWIFAWLSAGSLVEYLADFHAFNGVIGDRRWRDEGIEAAESPRFE